MSVKIIAFLIICYNSPLHYYIALFLKALNIFLYIPIAVTVTMSINIFSHTQHALYEKIYHIANLDPETESRSDHDNRMCMYRETKYMV
jgi:hypothetical protein